MIPRFITPLATAVFLETKNVTVYVGPARSAWVPKLFNFVVYLSLLSLCFTMLINTL